VRASAATASQSMPASPFSARTMASCYVTVARATHSLPGPYSTFRKLRPTCCLTDRLIDKIDWYGDGQLLMMTVMWFGVAGLKEKSAPLYVIASVVMMSLSIRCVLFSFSPAFIVSPDSDGSLCCCRCCVNDTVL